MHRLYRIGLFGITILLLLGFWAGLWYHGYRKGSVYFSADGGISSETPMDAQDNEDIIQAGDKADEAIQSVSYTGDSPSETAVSDSRLAVHVV